MYNKDKKYKVKDVKVKVIDHKKSETGVNLDVYK